MAQRIWPINIDPLDADGAAVPPGVPYGLQVADGGPYDTEVDGLVPVVSGLTSADNSVAINPNGDGTIDLATVGGGGGGSTVKDRRWTPGAAETVIDEFNDDSLAAAWVRVDGTGAAAGNVAWTEGGDTLNSRRIAANTGNKANGIVRPIGTAPALGDAWVTCVTQYGQMSLNYMMSGIIISDGTTFGAGKQVLAELLGQGGGAVAVSSYAFQCTNWDLSTGAGSTARLNPPIGAPKFLRLVYMGSSQWRADVSPSGVEWIPGASLVTQASFTPSHVGFYSRDGGSGTLSVAAYEFLRRVSGVS